MRTIEQIILTTGVALLVLSLLHTVSGSSQGDRMYVFSDAGVGAPSTDWESLVFWLAHGYGKIGTQCIVMSRYYCLDTYTTQNNNNSLDDPGELDPTASAAFQCPD